MLRVLVAGGYGTFGSRVAERLARESIFNIIIAGRDATRAGDAAEVLRSVSGMRAAVSHAVIDAESATASQLGALGAGLVINASGPFQAQTYALARAAIGAGIHYVDLADGRAFVTGITALDEAARAAGVAVISGASSVPGLSSVIVAALVGRIGEPDAIDIVISPGNSFDPGLATTRSILGYVGRPISMLSDGAWRSVYGWQGTRLYAIEGLGSRRLAGYCDVPDLDLLPARYHSLSSAQFRAGVEVKTFHAGMWALSWLVRAGLLHHAERLAAPLLAVKRRLTFLGSDRGMMMVRVEGKPVGGIRRAITLELVAGSGHGPYIPAIASVILATNLAAGQQPTPGAHPCFEMFSLEDFAHAVADLDVAWRITESQT